MGKSKQKWDGFSIKPRREMPEGLWVRCPGCEHTIYKSSVEKNMNVCPQCNHHFRLSADLRIQYLVDEGTFEEELGEMRSTDPLDFKFRETSYKDRLENEERKSGSIEAIKIGKAFIKGRGVILAVMDPNFLMGSMGAVVGEKFCAAAEKAAQENLPLVAIICSGGARMHESVIAVQQMAKTSAAVARLDEAGGLYIAVLTDPTTGGVTASFAMLGDVTIAEPGALIGFTGRRVIAETIKVELPEGFQTAEFMLEHGFIDMIVERKNLRSEIARLIDYTSK
ncbi:MAG: acetyl-CoA carboxylase, carboxyltransferase subunit beta [Phycisphaerae bacterium]|jgi:acetyl-CoA carboxylase carboxyl transferase subunit beta